MNYANNNNYENMKNNKNQNIQQQNQQQADQQEQIRTNKAAGDYKKNQKKGLQISSI